eukprot:332028-Rhodomonas_salina.5
MPRLSPAPSLLRPSRPTMPAKLRQSSGLEGRKGWKDSELRKRMRESLRENAVEIVPGKRVLVGGTGGEWVSETIKEAWDKFTAFVAQLGAGAGEIKCQQQQEQQEGGGGARERGKRSAIVLRRRYAVTGTDIRYAATRETVPGLREEGS